jgi:hypothetical protein
MRRCRTCNGPFGLIRHSHRFGMLFEYVQFCKLVCKESYLKNKQAAERKKEHVEYLSRPT